MKRYAVIMAGGSGERLWPESRSSRPKQFLALAGNRSLIQQSADRIASLVPMEQTFIVLGQAHFDLARKQLPKIPRENFLVEPAGRNTAPCLGLAALYIQKRDPEAVMLVFPADHTIRGQTEFHLSLEKAVQWAGRSDSLVTIGIAPSRPETEYGYLEREEQAKDAGPFVYGVRRFVEKPDLKRARLYIRSGRFYWNSGIFVWKARVILEEISRHLPELTAGLNRIKSCIGKDGEDRAIRELFPILPAVSIDYGVLEKSSGLLMVQGDFGWDDLGSWGALAEMGTQDSRGMTVRGNFVGYDNDGCFIFSRKGLIAALGVENMVIVRSGDTVLVCAKERTRELRKLLRLCREQKLDRFL